jgi:predicted XRE-type DNA-binding protein
LCYFAGVLAFELQPQTYADVFDALSDTTTEAANMKARANLLGILVKHVKASGLPQEAAAAGIGITPPRPDDLLRGNGFRRRHSSFRVAVRF